MTNFEEKTQKDLAKIVKDWDLAGKLVKEYYVISRPQPDFAANGVLMFPYPDVSTYLVEESGAVPVLYVDEVPLPAVREYWEDMVEKSHAAIIGAIDQFAQAETALTLIAEEEEKIRRNSLARMFNHSPGYDVLPQNSPLKHAIDYVIEMEKKL